MAEWTNEAREYLDGYLKQVAVLVREQGDDPEEVIAGLRDHIANEVEGDGDSAVTLGHLLPVLSELGAPEDVASVDLASLKLAPSRPRVEAPPEQPAARPMAPKKMKPIVVHRHWSPLSCVLVMVVSLVVVGIAVLFSISLMGTLAAIVIPNLTQAREAAFVEEARVAETTAVAQRERALCEHNLERLGLALRDVSQDVNGVYPPVDLNYSVVMFDIDTVLLDHVDTLSEMTCPSGPHEGKTFADVDDEYRFDYDYVYCSHVVTTDREFAGYLDAVSEAKRLDTPLTEAIILRDGSVLPRIWVLATSEKSSVPVLIERPGRHDDNGYNVLFLDGRVEYGTVDENRFPWTEAVASLLADME